MRPITLFFPYLAFVDLPVENDNTFSTKALTIKQNYKTTIQCFDIKTRFIKFAIRHNIKFHFSKMKRVQGRKVYDYDMPITLLRDEEGNIFEIKNRRIRLYNNDIDLSEFRNTSVCITHKKFLNITNYKIIFKDKKLYSKFKILFCK